MLSLSKLGLSEYAEKPRFGYLNLNNSEIFRLSFEDIFLGRLDTYTKKMNPPSAVRGGVCGKVCWLIAYWQCQVHFYNLYTPEHNIALLQYIM